MSESFRPCRRDRKYLLSTKGRIFNSATRNFLKGQKNSEGYITIWFAEGYNPYLHDLMTETFIGPKPKGFHVNHKNGIKTDNRPINLEYVTPSRNVIHGLGLKAMRKRKKKQS